MSQETIQGVLCMNKPAEFTSFDVIGKLRGILRMRRLGHTGTLDPMATGVLSVLVGRATRACDILPDQDKTYRASVQFGWETDTEDVWGVRTAVYPEMHVTKEALESVLSQFRGEIWQVPPMYSAVSVDGKRLYELARKGVVVDRPARKVQIHTLTLETWNEDAQTAELLVSCGKGTYIRTLLSDIGKALGGGAVMTALCRTQASGFSLEQCYTFEDVKRFCREGSLASHLIPTDRLFAALPALHLTEKQSVLYGNGVKLDLEQIPEYQDSQTEYRVYDAKQVFLGTALAEPENSVLRVGKNFN
ncbi:tRNA pseudouridine(55) synthase TruB [Ruminococcus sp.]|uniref:tRNA pseudouridine(55) synthase TruB n=1 Tax=Ruminococcus sp. TaxID=41978 RepID=UPI0025CDEBF7|nr:tRNA pseudouridine(55) synthase TruB [Ruminococcus sp.]